MKTIYSAIALGAMLVAFGAAAAGVSQERIPYLQREVPKDPINATLTGCVARGAAAGTYILKNITKDGEMTGKGTFERMSVVLSGTGVDVSKHVGHRVSVTGLYSTETLAIGTLGTPERAPVAEEVSQGEKKATGTFRVTSLVMVADSCSQPAD
jgi:hypothetical protein